MTVLAFTIHHSLILTFIFTFDKYDVPPAIKGEQILIILWNKPK